MKEKILKYLTKRRDYVMNMMQEQHKESGEIDSPTLEVFFTYNAIISDIENDKLES